MAASILLGETAGRRRDQRVNRLPIESDAPEKRARISGEDGLVPE